MKTLKKMGALAAVILLMCGCGNDEAQLEGSGSTPKASMNKGVEQVEAQKSKEQQAAEEIDKAQKADAELKKSASNTETQMPASKEEQRKLPEAKPGDEPTPERTSIHTIVLKNKYGKVAFNHAAHTEFISCSTCHPTEPPSRIDLNRKEYHSICRTCHHEMGAGPVKCSACHEH